MRHSGLCLAVIFLFSSFMLAQHSSGGGGGGSAGSSSTGGGGSHGGGSYSGGSSSSGGGSHGGSSGGGHSSGGSASHGSGGHSSGMRGTHSSPNATSEARANAMRTTNLRQGSQSAHAEKRSFFSFLRHPFRKPEPKQVTDLRRPVCLRGPCQVCPNGQIAASGGCGALVTTRRYHSYCARGQLWSGGECMVGMWFLDDCEAYRAAMQQQADRVHNAEMARQNACAGAGTQSCALANTTLQSEQSLYRDFASRYQQCRARSQGAYSFGGFGTGFHALDSHPFDPLSLDLNH